MNKLNKSQMIKSILVNLAAADELPQDMTTLDEHIFDVAFADTPTPTERELEAKAEQHALGQFLSEYPENMDYDEIIERLSTGTLDDEDGNTLILIWEPFENRDPSTVAEDIENCKETTFELIKEILS